MKEHKLKFQHVELCDAVYDGRKPFEMRRNDRDFQVGDIIQPIAIDENEQPFDHPINNMKYRITYVAKEWPGVITEGYCVFGIEPVQKVTKIWKVSKSGTKTYTIIDTNLPDDRQPELPDRKELIYFTAEEAETIQKRLYSVPTITNTVQIGDIIWDTLFNTEQDKFLPARAKVEGIALGVIRATLLEGGDTIHISLADRMWSFTEAECKYFCEYYDKY